MDNCCSNPERVWVNKHSDQEAPTLTNDGKPSGQVEYVDVNLYRCKNCDDVTAFVE